MKPVIKTMLTTGLQQLIQMDQILLTMQFISHLEELWERWEVKLWMFMEQEHKEVTLKMAQVHLEVLKAML